MTAILPNIVLHCMNVRHRDMLFGCHTATMMSVLCWMLYYKLQQCGAEYVTN